MVLGQLDAGTSTRDFVVHIRPTTSDLRHTQPWGAELTWAIFGAAGSLDKVLASSLDVRIVA